MVTVVLSIALCGQAYGNVSPEPSGPCRGEQECDRCRFEGYGGLCITICGQGWDDDSAGEEHCELECVTNLDSPLLDECPDTSPSVCAVTPTSSATCGAGVLLLTWLLLSRRRRTQARVWAGPR